MKRIVCLGLLLSCICAWIAFGETTHQFVKDKRTKKVSTARLKEEIGELIGDSLLHSTSIVEHMGKLQKELMQMMAALMEQHKESKLTNADRIALDKTIEQLQAIQCDLDSISKRLAGHKEVIKKQY